MNERHRNKRRQCFSVCFFLGGAGGRINCWETWRWLDLTFVVSLIVNEGCVRIAALQCLKSILESSSSLWPRIQHNPIESSNVFFTRHKDWMLKQSVLTSWPNRKFVVKLFLEFVEREIVSFYHGIHHQDVS